MEQAQALRKASRKYEDDNELTFLVDVWSKFLSVEDTGLVISTVDDQLEDEEEAIRWIEAAWEKDHLKCNWNAKFTRGSIPLLDFRDSIRQHLADRAPRVKSPKPDLIYGLPQNAFSVDEQYINNKYGAALSLNTEHPFFVVESFSVEEPMGRAENRCAVGGAAMVRLKRRFDILAKATYHDSEAHNRRDKNWDYLSEQFAPEKETTPIDYYRTDINSFAFSLIINPRYAEMFVHWAEEAFSKEGQLLTISWYTNHLECYSLRNPAGWIDLHRALENVLDWGVLMRKQEMKDLCNQIFAREGSDKRGKL